MGEGDEDFFLSYCFVCRVVVNFKDKKIKREMRILFDILFIKFMFKVILNL